MIKKIIIDGFSFDVSGTPYERKKPFADGEEIKITLKNGSFIQGILVDSHEFDNHYWISVELESGQIFNTELEK